MTDEDKKNLETQLWNIANTLRGKMHADEFRDYILGFIFYKYLSEKLHLYANEILGEDEPDYTTYADDSDEVTAIAEEAIAKLGYMLKPSELFGAVAKRGNAQIDEDDEGEDEEQENFILGDLTKILANIQNSTLGTESEEDFINLFEDLDLTSSKLGRTEKAKNHVIAQVLAHLDKINFDLANKDGDVLGDAYEYLIGQFASGAGKKAGEFYTPQSVSKIIAKLVTADKGLLKNVYDPACGSGSLLLRVAREVEEVGEFYGQELNRTTYNLARMNMILHDVNYRKFDIKQEDTLENPQHLGMKFEAIVANPPFSAKWSSNTISETDDRFADYGRLAPASKADFAFIQHMISHMADNGNMAVVMPHGVLYRGAAEGHIRQFIVEELNYLDAVIGLPPNIFFGTTYSTCILVFKRCRTHPKDVFILDASACFEKGKNKNVLLQEHIDLIIDAYNARVTKDKLSHVATLDEIRSNDYNLNITRYIDTFEPEPEIMLDDACKDLASVSEELTKVDTTISGYCSELNLPSPIGHNISILKHFKQSVLQKLFNQEIRFTSKDGKQYPAWQEIIIGQEFEYLPTNSFARNLMNNERGHYQNIHYGDIHTKFPALLDLNAGEVPYVNEEINLTNVRPETLCRVGDIVVADASEDHADVGKALEIVGLSVTPTLAGLHTLHLRAKSNFAPGFLGYLFQCFVVRKQIMRLAQGTKVLGIPKGYFSQVKLPVACFNEQEKISGFLIAIDKKITLLSTTVEPNDGFKLRLFNEPIVNT